MSEIVKIVNEAVGAISKGLRPADFGALIRGGIKLSNPLHARIVHARNVYVNLIVPRLERLAGEGRKLTPRTYAHFKQLRLEFVRAYNKRLDEILQKIEEKYHVCDATGR